MITYPTKKSHLLGFAPPRTRAPQRNSSLEVPQDSEGVAEPLPSAVETQILSSEAQSREMQVVIARGKSELAPYIAAWQELADVAGEPNVFYEPWMLLPALEAFAPTPAPEFHLVFAPGRGPDAAKPLLWGVFPLTRERRYKGLRAQVLRGWRHLYCPLGTPLVRRGQEARTLQALLDFLGAQKGGASLLELGCVSGDGPFGRALIEVFDARGATTFIDESWTRAMLRPQSGRSGEEYLAGAMSGKRRKEFRRKEYRLADRGAVQYTELGREADPGAALDSYLSDFLRLEASGWKGESGSAFACDAAHQKFFRAVASEAHARGRLVLSKLCVGGVAVAAKCDFLAGTGAYAFKIGFDEEFARFSPGVLLEMESIRQLHAQGKLRWMDSCAVRNHPMINRLWLERRALQTVVIATGRGRSEFIVAGLGLLRHFKRAARRSANRNVNQSAQKPKTAAWSDA